MSCFSDTAGEMTSNNANEFDIRLSQSFLIRSAYNYRRVVSTFNFYQLSELILITFQLNVILPGECESTQCQCFLNMLPEYAAISQEGTCTLTYVTILPSVTITAIFSKTTKFCQMDFITD